VSNREARQELRLHSKEPEYTMLAMRTGDALLCYAEELKTRGQKVCALNFANGSLLEVVT